MTPSDRAETQAGRRDAGGSPGSWEGNFASDRRDLPANAALRAPKVLPLMFTGETQPISLRLDSRSPASCLFNGYLHSRPQHVVFGSHGGKGDLVCLWQKNWKMEDGVYPPNRAESRFGSELTFKLYYTNPKPRRRSMLPFPLRSSWAPDFPRRRPMMPTPILRGRWRPSASRDQLLLRPR